jgi:hypothetical protein
MNYTRPGFYIVILVVFGILIPVIVLDLVLTWRRKRPVGFYMNEFMVAYPWFSMLVALVVGAMIAHFFLNIADN